MPQQSPYLSVDPNEGEPLRVQSRGQQVTPTDSPYLSTDPNDGEAADFRADNAVDEQGQNVIAPPESAPSRFGSNLVKALLPSTTPSDYIEGPKYAAQNPGDALALLAKAIWDAHVGQAEKTAESAKGIVGAPTLGGKLGALSETLGHGAATILPMIGPAAANAGEQIGSGDIAGGLGSATGLLAPNALVGMRGTAPAKAVAGKLHQSAATGMEKAINPTRVDTKVKTQRIVPEMLRRRVKAGNLQKLEDVAETRSAQAGAKVDEALAPHNADTVDTMAVVDELEKSKAEFMGKAEDGRAVVNDPTNVKAIQKLQDTLMEYGDRISVESMRKLRQNWDKVVDKGKGFVTDKVATKAWAAREGRTALRDELAKAVPDLDKVNAEYAFWQTLEDVTHASNQRKTGQKGNLVSTIAGGAGAVAMEAAMPGSGLVKGGLQAAIGAKLFSSVSKFLNSPGYQMWSAVQKERLADALMAKDTAKIQGLLHAGAVATSKGSRAAGRVQSGRPVPQAADATDREDLPRSSRRDTRQ